MYSCRGVHSSSKRAPQPTCGGYSVSLITSTVRNRTAAAAPHPGCVRLPPAAGSRPRCTRGCVLLGSPSADGRSEPEACRAAAFGETASAEGPPLKAAVATPCAGGAGCAHAAPPLLRRGARPTSSSSVSASRQRRSREASSGVLTLLLGRRVPCQPRAGVASGVTVGLASRRPKSAPRAPSSRIHLAARGALGAASAGARSL